MATRIIRTKGRYNLSQFEREQKQIRVYGGCVEQPSNQSINFTFNVPETYYGHAQLCSGDIVLQTKSLKYDGELLFQIDCDLDTLLTLHFFCATVANLNRSAQEWTQYAALPFTLVSPALQAFFLGQATSLDPPILERLLPDCIRVTLYADTAYKIDVRTTPFDVCVAANSAVFQEPVDKANPPQFPDSPAGTNTPSSPYPGGDPDTPNPTPPGGLGGSNYLPGQPYGVAGQPYTITGVVDLPGGACSNLPSNLQVGFSQCNVFPLSFTFSGIGTFIPSDLVRDFYTGGSDNFAALKVENFDVSTATMQSGLLVSSSTPAPVFQPISDGFNWTVQNAQIVSFVVT